MRCTRLNRVIPLIHGCGRRTMLHKLLDGEPATMTVKLKDRTTQGPSGSGVVRVWLFTVFCDLSGSCLYFTKTFIKSVCTAVKRIQWVFCCPFYSFFITQRKLQYEEWIICSKDIVTREVENIQVRTGLLMLLLKRGRLQLSGNIENRGIFRCFGVRGKRGSTLSNRNLRRVIACVREGQENARRKGTAKVSSKEQKPKWYR